MRFPPLVLPRSGSAGRRHAQPPSQPGCPELPYAAAIVTPEAFVAELAAVRIGTTFNQYSGSRLRRERLVAYLESRRTAPVLLVGEAPGYRGARVSGIPFTSERQLTGSGPAEATATVVQRVLAELRLREHVLLWNVVPTHPGTEGTNRAPRRSEILAGLPFVEQLHAGRVIVAVGRTASRALGVPGVRHPSRGGAQEFRSGLLELLDRGERELGSG
jgi:uracil-DNA glycosylase family 4